MKKTGKRICIIILLLIIAGGIAYGWQRQEKQKTTEVFAETQGDEKEDSEVSQGEQYKYNTDMKAVLLLGVESATQEEKVQYQGNGEKAAAISLLILDEKKMTAQILQIPEEMMSTIEIYDTSGEKQTEKTAQIAYQYTYGNSTEKSCLLMKDAVSKLLDNIPLHAYIAINTEGMSKAVDAIGGVPITMDKDYSDINSLYKQGTQIIMDGNQASLFLRYRNSDSNEGESERIDRQKQFIKAAVSEIKKKNSDEEDFYKNILDHVEEYINTDLSAEEIENLEKYTLDDEILQLQGESQQGEEGVWPDKEKVQQFVLKTFYQKKTEDKN